MTTPELKIEPKLPVLAFNFEQLKIWATALAERYANIVVTEDAIADVKRDMAELNKAKKAVDDARKEAVRRVSEPIRAFEAQIREVCGIFDSAYSALGAQVKGFEGAQREEKRKTVDSIIHESLMQAFGDAGRMTIPMQEKWLNKTTSLKSIGEDVTAIIERFVEDENRTRALEQAKQDRFAAIESHVKALNKQYGFTLYLSYFFGDHQCTDLNTPLPNVLSRIERCFAQEAETMKQKAQVKPQVAQVSCESPVNHQPPCVAENAQNEPQAAPAQTRAMSIVIEYDAANEAKILSLLVQLKPLCINYGERRR